MKVSPLFSGGLSGNYTSVVMIDGVKNAAERRRLEAGELIRHLDRCASDTSPVTTTSADIKAMPPTWRSMHGSDLGRLAQHVTAFSVTSVPLQEPQLVKIESSG